MCVTESQYPVVQLQHHTNMSTKLISVIEMTKLNNVLLQRVWS